MHSLLKRQIRKYLQNNQEFLQKYEEFLQVIDQAYKQFDDDRTMLERSLELSSQELIQANSEMRAIFQAFPDLFFLLDEEGKILDFKTGSSSDLFLEPNEFLGKNIKTIPLGNVSEKINKAFEEIKKTGKITNIDYSLEMNGVRKFFEARFVPLKNNQIITIIRNITDRKNAEMEFQTLASVVKHSSELISLVSLDGKIIFLNEAGQKMLGITEEEVHYLHLVDLLHEEYRDEVVTTIIPSIKRGENWEGNLQYKNLKNGILIDVHNTAFLIKDIITNEPLYFANISLDITDQKKAEDDLKKAHHLLEHYNKDLEKKVEERTMEINKLLKQKNQFIYQLGHDLKNPLGPLINLVPILEKKCKNEENVEVFKVVQRNVTYMKNLVKKTLELARLNSTDTVLKYQDLNIRSELNDIIKTNEFLFEENDIKVQHIIPSDLTIHADPLCFHELFHNLLNNAVKYSPSGGVVSIQTKEMDDAIQIELSDQGNGMSEKQIEHIFDEFYKADSSRHDFDSSGLGLPICKRIMERHNGLIWVRSAGVGQGSTFYLRFPLKKPLSMKSGKYSYQDIINRIDEITIHH